MQNQSVTLTELISRATEYLYSLNYSEGTISHYRYTWNHLKKYATRKGVSTFTLELGMQFLLDHYNLDPNTRLSCFHVSLVRRIKVLEEFKNTSRSCLCHQKRSKKVPERFTEIFKSYQKLQSDFKFTQWTVQSKSIKVRDFLIYLELSFTTSFEPLLQHL